jgi:predicted CXXCH cytochrome family protein
MLDQRASHGTRRTAIVLGLLVAAGTVGLSGLLSAQVRPAGSVESCVTAECHSDVARGRSVHGPVAHRKCDACHVEVDAETHRYVLAADPADLCTTCHATKDRTYLHAPVRQGNCTGCHDPHSSEHPLMLHEDPTRGLCLTCHRESEGAARAFVHGPVATGACILCHESHSSWQPALLTEPPRQLCLGCHPEIEPDAARDRHRHVPVEEGCAPCHDPHASDHRHQLHEPAPELCYRCHGAMRDELGEALVVHGAVTQEGGCQGCHSPHYSSLPAMQKRLEIDLCLGCHDEPVATADGRMLTDMAALLASNPDHHGPIRDGACTACHLPHASRASHLLRKSYPPEFYAPYEPARYALCFECHLPQMVKSPRGTGATRFRHGDRNLHWLHVNREKGRTCRACHEVHASKNPFHMRDSVPFGTQGWQLEIRFERTPTGGSCAPGCHARESYDRTIGDRP